MTYNWNAIRIPTKITPCTIEEAVVELRFETDTPKEAVFGILYNSISSIYPTVKNMPIMELPDTIRATDPGLAFQPHYQVFKDDKFSVMIGPKVISLISKKPYVGWREFFPKIKELIEKTKVAGCIKKYTRLGLRYINIFDVNIFDKIVLSINMGAHAFGADKSAVRLSVPIDGYINDLRISNNPVAPKALPVGAKSVIDIDTYIENDIADAVAAIEKAHAAEKKLFFSLLQPEYLKTFSPEY